MYVFVVGPILLGEPPIKYHSIVVGFAGEYIIN